MKKQKDIFSILQDFDTSLDANSEAHKALPKEEDSSGFCVVTDVVPDAILEVRYYSTYNFIGDRIDGYERPIIILTKQAAFALRYVSDKLKDKGYRLKLFDGYRPQRAVDMFIHWAEDSNDKLMKPYFYPEIEKDQIIQGHYIAKKSGHTRGSTIDLTLFDMATGREVDMGGPYDYFGELSHPNYPVGGKPGMKPITQEQYDMRQLIREAMIEGGFQPLESEWWHFTLKDESYPDTYFMFPVNENAFLKKDK